jgi:abequosyltransferase
MHQKTLSICIPIYNFAKYIPEALDSILPQIDENDEIIVVDGGSQDGTQDVMRAYTQKYPHIQYHRFEQRGGIDVDIEKSVSLAKGEYCWLFSGDDIMLPGSILKVKEQIKHGYDVYICSFTIHSLDMRDFIRKHPIFKLQKDVVFHLDNPAERKEFFEQAITTTALFSFMSSLIIKRSTWEKAGTPPQRFMESCWGHVARLFSGYKNGLSVKFLTDIYLKKRDGNDSFLDKGLFHRVGISIHGFHDIANTIFGFNSFEAFHTRRVLRNEFTPRTMLAIIDSSCRGNFKECSTLIRKLYCDKPSSYYFIQCMMATQKYKIYPLLRKIKRLLIR